MNIIRGTNFNFLRRRRLAYLLSGIVILLGLTVFGMRGQGNFGADFTGGDILKVKFESPTSVSDLRAGIGGLDIGHYTVQALGAEGLDYMIRSNTDTSDDIVSFFREKHGREGVTVLSQSVVSPAMSATLRRRAVTAFIIGLAGILVYLTVRFEFRFAVGATAAIFHDILFVVSIIALAGKQIDAIVIAALLTVAGYSVNDTVVVFDRIRENMRKTRSGDYLDIFNSSINQILSRTILTSLTTLFVVFCLFILGGEALSLFSLALLIGIGIGTYSSIYIASALIIDWDKISPHKFKI